MFISSKILAVVAVVFVSGSIAAPVPRRGVSGPLARRDIGVDISSHIASDASGKESAAANAANVLGSLDTFTGSGVGPLLSDPLLPMDKGPTESKADNPILVSRTETRPVGDWNPNGPSTKDPYMDAAIADVVDANASAAFSK